jgi:hypothetical protein
MAMARQRSDIMNVAGLLMNIIIGLVKTVQDKGGTDDDIRRLASEEGRDLLGKIADLIIEAGRKARDIFQLAVDYGRKLEDAIAAGHYDWVNENITEANFPLGTEERGKKKLSTKLFHFDRIVESKEAIREMEKEGYRPPSLREGLAFSEANPELQRQFPIVILGSVWVGGGRGPRVPMLYGGSARRGLYLFCLGGKWGSGSRFLAVRK